MTTSPRPTTEPRVHRAIVEMTRRPLSPVRAFVAVAVLTAALLVLWNVLFSSGIDAPGVMATAAIFGALGALSVWVRVPRSRP